MAGWYQGDSAVVLSTNDPIDSDTVQATAHALTQAVIARAPQMLAITGYGPTP
ncbi:hypothetical protein [Actinomyces slackii]|uniref:hypothetical protein n=1 Tax=Actinomyces slackii TaxID=52774 RepID=UPI0004106D34|nr:hypothetical protein [Actinomyces slackii]